MLRALPTGLFLLAILMLIPATSSAPPNPIVALAPVEILAEGFANLRGIAVDTSGAVFVADRSAGTITRIAPDHTRTVVAHDLHKPNGLAFGADGRLIVAESGARRVLRLETNGTLTPIVSGVLDPRWIAVSEDGAVFMSVRRITRATDPPASDDDELDDDAEPQMVLALRGGVLRVFADGLRGVEGVAIGSDALYVATRGLRVQPRVRGIVYRIPILENGEPGTITAVGTSDRYESPHGLGVDGLGALWVSTSKLESNGQTTPDSIAKISAAGVVSRFASRLASPQGLAFDAAGNLLVADGQRGRVLKFREPPPPALGTLPEFTAQSPLTITGTAEPGARLDVFVNDGVTPVTGTAPPTGEFSLSVPLDADVANDLEAFATGENGAGLTSPPTAGSLIHDGIRPAIDFTAPAAAAYVRGDVEVKVVAMDAGSDVRTLALTLGARSLSPVLTPPLPAPSVTALATWKTTAEADGTQTLVGTATDGAGNVTTVTRAIVVDNTPPTVSITDGPQGDVGETQATFTFSGADALTPTASLAFAWRLDGGAWSEFAAATPATFTALTQGTHTFEVKARDLAGNETPAPGARTFTVRSATIVITITEPAPGASIPAGLTAVRGIVNADGAEVGVTVNGVPASVQGTAFAALVPVLENPTALTATATARGATASATVNVSVTPPNENAVILSASPSAGLAPLTVTFSVTGAPADATLALDMNGDGHVDATGDAVDGARFTFAQPGLYVATLTVDGGAGGRSHAIVQVFDRAQLDALLQAKWTGLKDALRQGRVDAALESVALADRDEYRTLLNALTIPLAAIDTVLTDITMVDVDDDRVEYQMIRVDHGTRLSYFILFVRDADGVWRLRFF